MANFKLEVNNIQAVIKKMQQIPKEVEAQLQKELYLFGINTVSDAKRNAPVDESHLCNSITSSNSYLEVEIVVNADYGAYIEFGTRRFADQYVSSLPKEWQTFAAQFRGGGGGTFEELVSRLTAWVHRKGIAGTYSVRTRRRTGKKTDIPNQDKQVAYLIALKILREGIRPHPFLVPAVEKNRIELIKNLNKLFKK